MQAVAEDEKTNLLHTTRLQSVLHPSPGNLNSISTEVEFKLPGEGSSTSCKRVQNVKLETVGNRLYCCDTWHAGVAFLPRVSVKQLAPRCSFVSQKTFFFWVDLNGVFFSVAFSFTTVLVGIVEIVFNLKVKVQYQFQTYRVQ